MTSPVTDGGGLALLVRDSRAAEGWGPAPMVAAGAQLVAEIAAWLGVDGPGAAADELAGHWSVIADWAAGREVPTDHLAEAVIVLSGVLGDAAGQLLSLPGGEPGGSGS